MSKTTHSARFLVSLFLMSKYSLKYNLNSSHHSILRYLADLMDQNFKYFGIRHAKLSLSQVSLYSGCPLRTLKRSIVYLVSKRILKKEGKKGKMSIFITGNLLTAYQQRKAKVIHKKGQTDIEKGHPGLHLIESSNRKDNNKAIPKNDFENQKKKPKVLDEKHNREALKQLAKKLGKQLNYQ